MESISKTQQGERAERWPALPDRKSTRLNSSHPSISTLFPYTTLFRSALSNGVERQPGGRATYGKHKQDTARGTSGEMASSPRSEEHTSELQSPVHIYTLSLHDALPICAQQWSRETTRRTSNIWKA